MINTKKPCRGEVWDIRFDPSLGAEIQKVRPAVVISEDSIGRLPLRIVVPITEWRSSYTGYPWFVHVPANSTNGLSKESGADAFQVKSVSVKRFVTLRGTLADSQLDDIASAVALCVGAP
jgi:mRNA interferase MazF